MNNIEKEIKKMLFNGDIEEAIQKACEISDKAISIGARYNNAKKQFNVGRISREALSDIRSNLGDEILEIISQKEPDNKTSASVSYTDKQPLTPKQAENIGEVIGFFRAVVYEKTIVADAGELPTAKLLSVFAIMMCEDDAMLDMMKAAMKLQKKMRKEPAVRSAVHQTLSNKKDDPDCNCLACQLRRMIENLLP